MVVSERKELIQNRTLLYRGVYQKMIFLAEAETAEAEFPRLQNQLRLAIRFTAFGDGRINHIFVLNFIAAVQRDEHSKP